MSRTATDWAWSLSIKPASLKLLLLSMADRADEEHCCYPSIARLVKDTGLNSKTVQAGILKLVDLGVLKDTGERKGPTQRVRVFCLEGIKSGRTNYDAKSNDPKNGNIKKQLDSSSNDTENGNVPEIGNVPKNGTLNDTENGVLNDPKNGVQNHPLEPPIEPSSSTGVKIDAGIPVSEHTNHVIAPPDLFNTSLTDQQRFFPIDSDWQPNIKNLTEQCRLNRVNLSSFDDMDREDALREFVSHWLASGKEFTQAQWEQRFIKQLKYLQDKRSEQVLSPKNKRAQVSKAIMDVGDTNW